MSEKRRDTHTQRKREGVYDIRNLTILLVTAAVLVFKELIKLVPHIDRLAIVTAHWQMIGPFFLYRLSMRDCVEKQASEWYQYGCYLNNQAKLILFVYICKGSARIFFLCKETYLSRAKVVYRHILSICKSYHTHDSTLLSSLRGCYKRRVFMKTLWNRGIVYNLIFGIGRRYV